MLTTDAETMNSAPIDKDEFMDTQRCDTVCQFYAAKVGIPKTDFNYDYMGFLFRVSNLHGALQKVVPMSL